MPENHEIVIAIVAGTALIIFFGCIIILFVFAYHRRQLKYAREKEQLKFSYHQELLRTQLEIQEQTLQTISQEIHDNIGQILSLAKLNLGTMKPEQPEMLQSKIEDSKKLVAKAIQDLRDLAKGLNTDYVSQMGLQKSIGYQLEMINKVGSLKTHLLTSGKPVKLPAQQELILFRIIQELLHNILRHSNAEKIEVHLTFESNKVILVIDDDGQGFDLSTLPENTNGFGLGLRNMHNRAQLIGAEFNISSTLGKGTTATILLPLNH